MICRVLLVTSVALFYDLALAQEFRVDVAAVKALVSKWNEAHKLDKVETLLSVYSRKVKFYGSTLSRQKCLSIKQDALKKHPDFKQVLHNNLTLTGYSSGTIRCDFVKTVSRNNTEVEYQAYLLLKQVGGNYVIVGESDLTTDRRLNTVPALGDQVAIKEGKLDVTNQVSQQPHDAIANKKSGSVAILALAGSIILGVIGLVLAYQWLKPIVAKRNGNDRAPNPPPIADYYEMGLGFEKFVVEQFSIHKNHFTLKEWRSDKFHNGIFPKSNQNPDLEYEYKHKDFERVFAVECKYKSRAFPSIHIMDEYKYQNYKNYHAKMPVYVALGIGGEPSNPEELYLIPFQYVRTDMSYRELSKYKKRKHSFWYEMDYDRLT
jgi:hypothetical protein